MSNTIIKNQLEEYLKDKLKVLVYQTIDSTNKEAKRLKLQQDSLLITSHQSSGIGRYGRSFYSPKDEGVYFSIVLNNLKLNAQLFTMSIAVAITDVFENTTIKYLNDILYKNKKMAGILCEGIIENNQYKQMIIGVGININNRSYPKELENIMIGYQDENIDLNVVVSNIINRFFEINKLEQHEIIKLYKEKCTTLNQKIWIKNEVYYSIDITNEGYLVVIDKNGKELILNNVEVTQHA